MGDIEFGGVESIMVCGSVTPKRMDDPAKSVGACDGCGAGVCYTTKDRDKLEPDMLLCLECAMSVPEIAEEATALAEKRRAH